MLLKKYLENRKRYYVIHIYNIISDDSSLVARQLSLL